MIQDQPSRKRKIVLLSARLLLILGLWLGGTYIFEALNHLRAVPQVVATNVEADGAINVWWPTNNAKVSGLQPFKAMVQDKNVSDYDMFWSVDGGQPNKMYDSSTDYPHKEASVDLTSWTWHGAGPYKVTFRALDTSGNALGETSVDIYRPDISGTPTVASVLSQVTSVPTVSASVTAAPIIAAPVVVAPVIATPTPTPSVTPSSSPSPTPTPTSAFVSAVFPATNSHVTGTQTFKAAVQNINVNDYSMYWQVDNGQHNAMNSANNEKEASVNVDSWKWHGTGPYVVKFTAEKNGQAIGSSEVSIYTDTNSGSQTSSVSTAASQPFPAPVLVTAIPTSPINASVTSAVSAPVVMATPSLPANPNNPLSGLKFFVNPNSNAKQTADGWRSSRPADAALMDKIANSPEAIWLGGWSGDVKSAVSTKINAAKSQGTVPVFIAYNIPNRDCGSYSAGGVNDAGAYSSWIQGIANGLGGSKAVVVLEPDSLSLTDCLSSQQKTDRFTMISNAVSALKSAGAVVYIDAGHPNWISADDMASRLKSAGVDKADGFALNVSNFYATSDNINYGTQISGKLGGKHFVVDTARNGQGNLGDQWCNPPGRGLGVQSTTNTGNLAVDAFLWLKNPGESDGNCNGGPSAGVWWPDYALGLAQRAAF